MENEKKQIDKEIKKYVDPITGMTTKQLRVGYWWVTHENLFHRAGLIALIIVDLILIFVSLAGWGWHIFSGVFKQKEILSELSWPGIESQGYAQQNQPAEFQVISTNVFTSGDDKYDIVMEIVNPNAKWFADFSYRFVFRGGQTPWRDAYLLPVENSIRGELGFSSVSRPREVGVEFRDLKWKRISPRPAQNPALYVKERSTFDIRDAEFIPGNGAGRGAENSIRFTVENVTPFSFWRVPFIVAIMRGGVLTGVETVTIEPFNAGESRQVNLATEVSGSNVGEIKILPLLNIFDNSIYKTALF